MLSFLEWNTDYPTEAKIKEITGVVKVSFVVEKDGSITNTKIEQDAGGGCGKEALRVINQMAEEKKWTPWVGRGKPRRTLFIQEFVFKHNDWMPDYWTVCAMYVKPVKYLKYL